VVIGAGRHPGARVVAEVAGNECRAHIRDAGTVLLTGPDPTVQASVAYAWHLAGRPLSELADVRATVN
jgi:hypothetical protein